MSSPMAILSKTGDHVQCPSQHDPVATGLAVFLCIGLVVSYLPQVIRIILKKSSLGFSPWFLLLGATSSSSSFLNVVALQWGLVRCCSIVSTAICAESVLGILQVGLQWLCFVAILALFLIYYPKELRYERSIALPGRTRRPRLLAEDDDTSSGGSSAWSDDVEDLDSLDSHIQENYSGIQAVGSGVSAVGIGTPTQSAVARITEEAQADASSSAFARLVPTFWPIWKAPQTEGAALGPPGRQTASGAYAVPGMPSAPGPMDQSNQPGSNLLQVPQTGSPAHPRTPSQTAVKAWKKALRKKSKRRTAEWSLSLALAWVVALHFIFVFLITLLLVTSLPTESFPDPRDPTIPNLIPAPLESLLSVRGKLLTSVPKGSKLLVQRWAAFLGVTGTILAAGQYIPQIIYTARAKLVGSLSIPMMCLQVPGSVIFVYSLAIRPGTDWSSLAAFVATGTLQLVLLALCISWKIRQNRLGIDDFGRPLVRAQGLPSQVALEED
ncbi:hypothetical protein K437DRAFT_253557 [Tilletiaria anomala UBC 951]|uniref:PQ-loop-domain-containing protein n=1 Tax=Tilletiaria anomala (strain ATCC 24038 / CBS 436.72 / UBC 951) TaxID=1037660 RepID=A0A066WQM0_TILAU|nr:uncharacterized protein K437DRAFT_253557 [Tilletiaria anomala UBC 951]KDN52925.1 hypothetical protein K437DRAFT_253557 [Tilletiaria anomala UBC 951]